MVMRTQRAILTFALIIAVLIVLFPGSGSAAGYAHDGKLLPALGASGANFGQAVAIDGVIAVVAAPGENSGQGAVHVFERLDSGWQHRARLTASDGASGDLFGGSVAISGDIVVVGSATDDNSGGADAGTVYLFVKPASGWADMTESRQLFASDAAANHTFGSAVAITGTTLVVGASGHENGDVFPGAVYIFEGSDTNWNQSARLTASDGSNGDLFGFSLDMDGNTVVVGAYGKEQKKGAAYVFEKPASGWADATESNILTAQDRSVGDQFGFDLAIDGGRVIVGADGDDDSGADAGAVYLFSGADWSVQEKHVPTDGFADQGFGYAVDIFNDTAVVGALLDDDKGQNSGSVYVYGLSSGMLAYQEKLLAPDGGAEDRFGSSVAMTDSSVIAGAYRDTVGGQLASGSAYVFSQAVDSNAPPQAQNDSFETEEDTPVTITDVLANDTDPDGDTLSISLVDSSSAQSGTVVDNGNGTFTYTPPAGYTGSDSFNYSISDGNGGEAQATVLITVKPAGTTTDEGDGSSGGGGTITPWLLLLMAGFYQLLFRRKRWVAGQQ